MRQPQMNYSLLKRIRDKFDPQMAFAFAIGETDTFVSRVVRGWKPIPPDRKEKWAEALGCKVKDLEKWESHDENRVDGGTEVGS